MYLKKEDRERFNAFTKLLDEQEIREPSELTYLLTMVLHKYLNQKPENYASYNEVVGALECVKLELYRRHISSHENIKIKEHGDV